MAFDIMKQIKQAETSSPIQLVDLDLIDFNDANTFSMDQQRVEALADEIIAVGFKSVIELRDTNDGRYQLIAGETRTRAMRLAYQQTGDPIYARIPAYVNSMSDIEAKERLVTDELLKRTHTPYEKLMAVEMLQEIYEKKKKDEDLPGRVQYMIASATGMKKSQVGTYQKIIKDATPEVKDLIKKEKITVDNAKELAKLPKQEQKELIKEAQSFSKDEIQKFKDRDTQLKLDDNNKLIEESIPSPTPHIETISDCLNSIDKELRMLHSRVQGVEFRDEAAQLLVVEDAFQKLMNMLIVPVTGTTRGETK